MDKEAKTLIAKYNGLKERRDSEYSPMWEDVAKYTLPRKTRIVSDKTVSSRWVDRLYDDTAAQANLTLAAGIVTNTTPATDRWFSFEPPHYMKVNGRLSSEIEKWFHQCREIIMEELASSNFHSEVHEAHLERNSFGTCALSIMPGKKTSLNFQCLEVGSYVIAEDDEGLVDTVIRELKLTAKQMVQMFGMEAVERMEKVKTAYESTAPQAAKHEFSVLHFVLPREDAVINQIAIQENQPFASIYVCVDEQYVISESGFYEMPYAVSRFLNWPGEVWGWGPGILTLPRVRQINFIQKQLDLLAEKQVDPPVLVPSNMYGQVDFRAGGTTIYDENNPNAMPREWQSQGRYDIGKDRVNDMKSEIKDAYYNDLFRMFSEMTQRITAYEAMQRVSEKLELFSPTFQRITNEMLTPIIKRSFAILLREGKLPDPPADVIMQDGTVPVPTIQYQGKLALAIKALETRSFSDFQQIMGSLAQMRPDILDVLDLDQVTIDIARNLGLPSAWIRKPKDIQQIRQERAEAQRAQEQMMMAGEAAKAAGNMGKAPKGMQDAITESL